MKASTGIRVPRVNAYHFLQTTAGSSRNIAEDYGKRWLAGTSNSTTYGAIPPVLSSSRRTPTSHRLGWTNTAEPSSLFVLLTHRVNQRVRIRVSSLSATDPGHIL